MPQPIRLNSANLDMQARGPVSTTVVASPAAAAETIIASLTIPSFGDTTILSGVIVSGWAAYTVGTNGTAVTFRVRQTNVVGSVVVSSGALTKVAASLYADDIQGVDATPGVGVYVLTMQVTSGSASSAVSATCLSATVV